MSLRPLVPVVWSGVRRGSRFGGTAAAQAVRHVRLGESEEHTYTRQKGREMDERAAPLRPLPQLPAGWQEIERALLSKDPDDESDFVIADGEPADRIREAVPAMERWAKRAKTVTLMNRATFHRERRARRKGVHAFHLKGRTRAPRARRCRQAAHSARRGKNRGSPEHPPGDSDPPCRRRRYCLRGGGRR